GNQAHEPGGDEARRHQGRGGAALQERRDAHAGKERLPPAPQPDGQRLPQVAAEGAHDAAVHHVHPPQQERDVTGQLEQCKGCRHSTLLRLTYLTTIASSGQEPYARDFSSTSLHVLTVVVSFPHGLRMRRLPPLNALRVFEVAART